MNSERKTRQLPMLATALLFVLLVFFAFGSTQVKAFSDGSGTEQDPYLISVPTDITGATDSLKDHIGSVMNGGGTTDKYYKITTDLTFDSWYTAGTNQSNAYGTFNGNLDGGGHTITLTSGQDGTRGSDHVTSFFHTIGSDGDVKNLNVAGSLTITFVDGKTRVAGIAGYNNGTIENCTFSGSITNENRSAARAAGIADSNNGTIKSCAVLAGSTITAMPPAGGTAPTGAFAGGIVVHNGSDKDLTSNASPAKIINCSNAATVKTYTYGVNPNETSFRAAGIAAINGTDHGVTNLSYGEISNCFNTGDIAGTAYIGGIAGYSGYFNTASVANCYNTGDVSMETSTGDCIGGIVGRNAASVTYCYSTGDVYGPPRDGGDTSNKAGIVGYNQGGTMKRCIALGLSVKSNSLYPAARVSGNSANLSLTSNKAREDLKVNDALVRTSNASGIEGETVALETAQFLVFQNYNATNWTAATASNLTPGLDLPTLNGTFAEGVTQDPTLPGSGASVTLNVNKDGVAYYSHNKTFNLYQGGASKYTGTGDDDSVTFSGVADGTYNIYDGSTDTGKTVTVSGADASETLNYYTIQFEIKDDPNGASSGSTISSATYDGTAIETGDVVLGGKTLVLTATGAGANTYDYVWEGTGTGGGTGQSTATLTIENLATQVDADCTVTGSNPSINTNPVSLTFGDQVVNTSSNPQTVTVTTSGLASDMIIGTASGFTITPKAGWNPITGGELDVVFSPTSVGENIKSFTLTSGTTTKRVNLRGTSIAKALDSLAVTTEPTKTEYVVGQSFNPAGMLATATFNDRTTQVLNNYQYTYSPTGALTAADDKITVSYTYQGVTKTAEQPITVVDKVLSSIAVTTEPTKTNYIEGESFETDGMEITATYNDGTTAVLSDDDYTYSPDGPLTTADNKITISYTEDGVTKTAEQTITVNPVPKTLSSIAVTNAPTKTVYTEGENFEAAGMVVTATYSDNSTKVVTTYTYEPSGALSTTDDKVTISYSENGVTKTAEQVITVNPAPRDPAITVNPSSLAFGNQEVGTTSTAKTIAVTGANLTADIAVGTADGFTITKAVGWNNRTGGTLNIVFAPTEAKTYSQILTISSTGADSKEVELSGTGIVTPIISNVSADPAVLLPTGEDSIITVIGDNLPSGLTVTAFDVLGNPTAITGLTDANGQVTLSFPENTSVTDDVVYTIKASLDNGVTWADATGRVIVTKNATSIIVSRDAIDFGDQEINTDSDPVEIKVSGYQLNGDITYAVSGDTEFTISESSWDPAIGGTLSVIFGPEAEGDYSGTITFTSTGADTRTVTLSGTGFVVPDPDPVITTDLPDSVEPNADDATTTLTIEAEYAATYQWYKDGIAIDGETGNSLTIDKTGGNGDYYVIVTGTNGNTVASNTANVKWISGKGTFKASVEQGTGTPKLNIDAEALKNAVLTDKEKAELDNNPNLTIEVIVIINLANEDILTREYAQKNGYTIGEYYTIEVKKVRTENDAIISQETMNKLNSPLTITMDIPTNLQAANRVFSMLRNHDDAVTVLANSASGAVEITFESDVFSPYTLVYKTGNTPAPSPTPVTGDNSNMNGWLALLTLSALVMSFCGVQIVRKRKEN